MGEEEKLQIKVLRIIRESNRPLDVNTVASSLNMSWWPTYKLIAETLFEKLGDDPEAVAKLPFIPIKSTKSLLIFPQHLLPQVGRADEK